MVNHDGTKVKARFRVADDYEPLGPPFKPADFVSTVHPGRFVGFVPSSVGGEVSKKAERRTRTKP